MIAAEAVDLAVQLGFADVRTAESLTPGLGGNELWRLRRDDADLLLRVFPTGADPVVAEREALAQRQVSRYGISVPQVEACATIGDRPVLAMEWVDGVGLARALQSGDRSAADLGRRCGLLLGRLHQVPAVTDPIVTQRSWIAWAGDFADALAPMLDDHDHRLLHLDFHPENLIITDDAGTLCLLDWANVRLGPPAADLARTLSILELIAIVPGLDDRAPELIMDFRTALLTGYAEAGGEIAVPAPMLAWAYAVQVHDLAGSWVPTSYLDQLRTKINNLLDG